MRVEKLPAGREPWLSETAFEHGALGISEALVFEQPPGEETVHTVEMAQRNLEIYFNQKPAADFLEKVRRTCPEARISLSSEVPRDWLSEWKKGFKPLQLDGPYWIVPSWCEVPGEAKHPLFIDPGMAFGTGTHETTRLVAKALVQLHARYHFQSCLDVGTGTGLLAILARQLGIQRVQATEIDSEARRVARENFTHNQVGDIALDETQLENLTGNYDIVVANIIDGVLIRLQDELKARVRPGGWLVVSGIIAERERDFLRGFELPLGRSWLKRVQMGDWLLFAARI